MTDDQPLVQIENLSKTFGRVKAVQGATFSVGAGETLALVGRNGAGKTTIMRMILGLLRPSGGKIVVFGMDLGAKRESVLARIGYVPEVPFLFPWMSVRKMAAFTQSFYAKWDDNYCNSLMERFRLNPDTKVGTLSKGTKVKLELTLALAHRPDLLVLDEPLSGLDPPTRKELIEEIVRVHAERRVGIVFSTHDVRDIEGPATHVAIMKDGTLFKWGSKGLLFDPAGYFGKPPVGAPPNGPIERQSRWPCEEGESYNSRVSRPAAPAAMFTHHFSGQAMGVTPRTFEEILLDYLK